MGKYYLPNGDEWRPGFCTIDESRRRPAFDFEGAEQRSRELHAAMLRQPVPTAFSGAPWPETADADLAAQYINKDGCIITHIASDTIHSEAQRCRTRPRRWPLIGACLNQHDQHLVFKYRLAVSSPVHAIAAVANPPVLDVWFHD